MTSLVTRLRDARTAVLSTAGFASLTASAWTAWGVAAGLGAAGMSLLVLEYLSSDSKGARS